MPFLTLEIKKYVFEFSMKDAAIYTCEEKTSLLLQKVFFKSCNILYNLKIPLKGFYNHPIKCKSIEMFFQTKQSSSKFKK